jgi:hypothetical protein
VIWSPRSMDRTQLCGSCDAGSIPAGITKLDELATSHYFTILQLIFEPLFIVFMDEKFVILIRSLKVQSCSPSRELVRALEKANFKTFSLYI